MDTDHPENQSPTNYGGYYAWGEMETKSTYNWSTYIHCDGTSGTCHNLGSDIAGTQYDVAHVKWGGSWQMPSRVQNTELIDNCTYEWTTENGVNGGKFTSKKNGASIFLLAASGRTGDNLKYLGSYGYYWSFTKDPDSSHDAYYLIFDLRIAKSYYGSDRDHGNSVRPVAKLNSPCGSVSNYLIHLILSLQPTHQVGFSVSADMTSGGF